MFTTTIAFFRSQTLRMVLTVAGIVLCILLMVFLIGIYRGVEEGSVAYFRSTDADLWVLQSHTTNLLRGFSILTAAHGDLLRRVEGVTTCAPVLFRLSPLETPEGSATVYLVGYDRSCGIGSPPHIVDGRGLERRGELVLDGSFAAKWGLSLGDSVTVQESTFHVVGFSGSTNMFVIQYGFADIDDIRDLYGVGGIVSAYIVRSSFDRSALADKITAEVPGTTVVSQNLFVAQNLQEMRSGFLPILLVLAILGGITCTAVVSLLLTLSVTERRREYAVLKAIGAPLLFLPRLLVTQAVLMMSAGFLCAGAAFVPIMVIIRQTAPEVDALIVMSDVLSLVFILAAIAALSAVLPLRSLRSIYPTEAFS